MLTRETIKSGAVRKIAADHGLMRMLSDEELAASLGGVLGGADLSAQVFLCYDVRCPRDEMNIGNVRTELTVTDRFGEGQLFVNERPTTKELCVPAVIGEAGPSPTPGPRDRPTTAPSSSPKIPGTRSARSSSAWPASAAPSSPASA